MKPVRKPSVDSAAVAVRRAVVSAALSPAGNSAFSGYFGAGDWFRPPHLLSALQNGRKLQAAMICQATRCARPGSRDACVREVKAASASDEGQPAGKRYNLCYGTTTIA